MSFYSKDNDLAFLLENDYKLFSLNDVIFLKNL